MSTLAVTIEPVTRVRPHPNADRLDLVDVLGWTVVAQRGAFQVGDLGVYFPIDSVLPPTLEAHIFPEDSKVKLSGSRVRTAKIRGEYSQGLLVPWRDAQTWPEFHLPTCVPPLTQPRAGQDVTELLKVVKYATPGPKGPSVEQGTLSSADSAIAKYTDLEHLAKHPESFRDGEPVAVTEKLHGTSARYGLVRRQPKNWWQRFTRWLGFKGKYEFVYGSRNVEYYDLANGPTPQDATQADSQHAWYRGLNVYSGIAKRLKLCERAALRVQPGELVFGEIIGEHIQKGYSYGAPNRTGFGLDFYVYDVRTAVGTPQERWLTHDELRVWCAMRGLNMVPTLYEGPYDRATVEALQFGPSVLDPNTPVREGCVVRYNGTGPRMVRKLVSKEFLCRLQDTGGSEDDELRDAAEGEVSG